jgi:hypothetical protein
MYLFSVSKQRFRGPAVLEVASKRGPQLIGVLVPLGLGPE